MAHVLIRFERLPFLLFATRKFLKLCEAATLAEFWAMVFFDERKIPSQTDDTGLCPYNTPVVRAPFFPPFLYFLNPKTKESKPLLGMCISGISDLTPLR